MYVMPVEPTHPGTEIKVTPEREAPIIPMDTMYQGDCLFPLKKVSLSAFLPVMIEIVISTAKYMAIIEAISMGFILELFEAKYNRFRLMNLNSNNKPGELFVKSNIP